MTDDQCHPEEEPDPTGERGFLTLQDVISMISFPRLERLVWIAPSSDYVPLLQQLINSRGECLRVLKLDFVEWPSRASGRSLLQPLLSSLFDTDYKLLQELELSGLMLECMDGERSDLDTLRVLSVQNCPGWSHFIAALAKSKTLTRLQSLEIQAYAPDFSIDGIAAQDIDGAESIRALLGTFRGLEEFHVSLVVPDWTAINKGLSRHQATLHTCTRDIQDSDELQRALPPDLRAPKGDLIARSLPQLRHIAISYEIDYQVSICLLG